ncbi:MAG: 4-(cytidine 5'-diphospho)-2-C-methyl-D-erythritol kinase [Candidatus Methylopumilus sp.]|nr:4-(cytidine 5'-diphospho)-2-C-methyl-D-erythritol kinase [Candidatus Methylopumilus sp.]
MSAHQIPANNQNFIEQGYSAFLAPAKINLFLHITGRRDDGYHLLQSAFRLVDFYDTIYLKVTSHGRITRSSEIEGVPAEQDLCIRAAKLLQAHTLCTLGVDIAVEKRIPMGGGLGGGSSDAATVLIALNQLWGLNLSRTTLMELGLKIGADVPFFIFGKNAWVEWVGEKLQSLTLPPAYYVIMTPKTHVPTAEIFSAEELTRNTFPTTIAAFSEMWFGKTQQSNGKWGEKLVFHNDLQAVVCKRYPSVASCLKWLNQFSTSYMSGSGASVFAAFNDEGQAMQVIEKAPKKIESIEVFCCAVLGLDQHPLYNLCA